MPGPEALAESFWRCRRRKDDFSAARGRVSLAAGCVGLAGGLAVLAGEACLLMGGGAGRLGEALWHAGLAVDAVGLALLAAWFAVGALLGMRMRSLARKAASRLVDAGRLRDAVGILKASMDEERSHLEG